MKRFIKVSKAELKCAALYFFPIIAILTILVLFVFSLSHQVLRQSANDPQVQIAEDLSDQISKGQNPETLVPPSKSDMSKTLSLFFIVFDDSGKPIADSVQLDGKTPVPPKGVFDYTKKHKEDRFTWQPKVGVRNAVVMKRYEGTNTGYLLVGRSLREVESRSSKLLVMTFGVWGALVVASVILSFTLAKLAHRK